MNMDRRNFLARASAALATLGVMGRVTLDRDLVEQPALLPNDAQLRASIDTDTAFPVRRVRTGLPPVQWRRLGKNENPMLQHNEILASIPWKKSDKR